MLAVSGNAANANTSILKQRVLSDSPAVQRLLLRIPRIEGLNSLLLQAGCSMTVGKFAVLIAGCALTGFVLVGVLPIRLLWSVLAGAVCSMLPPLYVMRAKSKRLRRIEQQLPEAVDLIARGLRAGHAFPNAVKMVGDEMADPIAGEFRTMFDEVNYGTSMQDALLNLASRVPSMDVKYLVIAVLIQRETGGNLAELLDNISSIIRARLKLLGTIRVLSAEGRLSAWVLALLPFGTALLINVMNPGFMSLLWSDPAGNRMVYYVLALMLFGIACMRKIIRIRV
jgi:tight adherence protein B